MSPGSFVSSESAGSSNSLDDPDVEPGSNRLIMTPLDDHVTPGNPLSNQANLAAKLNNTCFSFLVAATIFEESSAESCIEQTGSIERRRSEIASGIGTVNIPQFESRLAVDNAVAVNQSDDVNYTPIDIIPSSASATGMTSSNSILAASPPGTSTHYTTILAASMASMAASNTCSMSTKDTSCTPLTSDTSDYMVMSPSSTPASDSGPLALAMNTTRVKKPPATMGDAAPKHKPLTGLIDEISSISSSNVTSPNSQSSYNPLLDDNDLATSGAYFSDALHYSF